MVGLVRRWATYAGPVYDQPGVRLFVAEGRRFLEGRRDRYDMIQLALTLTTATEYGTFSAPDGHLYTLEAFLGYFDHLEPAGALSILDDDERRMTRLFITALAALAALHARGVAPENAADHLMVVHHADGGAFRFLLMASPSPWSAARVRAAAVRGGRSDFEALWLPGLAAADPYRSVVGDGTETFVRQNPLNLAPPTDNVPFPFHFAKRPRANAVALRHPLAAAALALMLGFAWTARSRRTMTWTEPARAGAIGLAFGLVEVGLLHRLGLAVGGPSQTLAVLLFSLLLWCGLGGAVIAAAGARRLGVAGACGLAGMAMLLALPWLDGVWLLAHVPDDRLRLVVTFLLLAPVGLALGTPLPSLLRRSEADHVGVIWGINGIGGVAGTMVAVAATVLLGLRETVAAGGAIYLLLALTSVRGPFVPVAPSSP